MSDDQRAESEPIRLAEAARRTGVCVRTLQRYIATHELPVIKLRNAVLVRPEDLEGFMTARRTAPALSKPAPQPAPPAPRPAPARRPRELPARQTDAWLPVSEVAARLSVGPATVRRLIADGELEAINVARTGALIRLRVPQSSLDAYVASRAIVRA